LSVWDNTASTNRGLKSITVTTQWQRFDITTSTVVAGNSTSFNIGTFASWTTGENILAWGAQLEAGSTATSYIPTTTAPVTIRDCRGLLIEESRTNLLSRSEEFENSAWSRAAVGVAAATITPNSDIAPDGTTTADTANFSATTATNQQGMLFRSGLTATIGQVVTFSVYMRVPSGTATVYIGLSEGSPISGQSVACNVTTTWQRFSITRTAVAATLIYTQIGPDTRSFAGQPAVQPAASVLLWGAQLEVGSFPTSYIPTTTGTLARSADVCNITGGDFTSFYNQSEGTMLTNAFTPASGDRTVLAADDNTANEMIRLRTEGNNPFFKVTDGGSELVAIDAGTVSANTSFKLIGAYKLNDFASSINGSSAVTDTSGTIPTVDRMRIGAGQGGNTMCGCVASLRYYKKRLPNAKLAQLTA
jgi:hypothetical protein